MPAGQAGNKPPAAASGSGGSGTSTSNSGTSGAGTGASGSGGSAGMTTAQPSAAMGGMTGGAAGGGGGKVPTGGGTGMTTAIKCASPEEEKFSFFLTSHAALTRESGNTKGFGGNFGGISGADALCAKIALSSSPCASNKVWRAFLSTTTENAIDRIGTGPWHDRTGRVLANTREDLIADRPKSADPAIINDLPNEFGVPNRNPDGTGNVDNHEILTGSGIDGKLYTQPVGSDGNSSAPLPPTGGRGGPGAPPGPGGTAGRPGGGGGFGSMTSCDDGWTPEKATCWNWTRNDSAGCPRVGHSWPRQGSGINWISVWNEGGCAPGVTLDDRTPPDGMSVGSFGGYGGFYCFAVRP